MEKPYYGYRINRHITATLVGGGILGIALAISFGSLGYSTWVFVLCWALGAILFLCGVFWHLAFGFVNDPKKIGELEANFSEQLLKLWDGKGKVLDIGTGLGRAAIEIAKRFPQTRVIGVDTWTKMWGYFGMTKAGAERNGLIEDVGDTCSFQYGNALELPFKDGEFQLVVSVFVFHEVRVPDRTVLFKEVVRVLAPGGVFLICDLFPRGYKVRNIPELLKKIEQLCFEDLKFVSLNEAGINLGGLAHIWGIGYLSGRNVIDTAS